MRRDIYLTTYTYTPHLYMFNFLQIQNLTLTYTNQRLSIFAIWQSVWQWWIMSVVLEAFFHIRPSIITNLIFLFDVTAVYQVIWESCHRHDKTSSKRKLNCNVDLTWMLPSLYILLQEKDAPRDKRVLLTYTSHKLSTYTIPCKGRNICFLFLYFIK